LIDTPGTAGLCAGGLIVRPLPHRGAEILAAIAEIGHERELV